MRSINLYHHGQELKYEHEDLAVLALHLNVLNNCNNYDDEDIHHVTKIFKWPFV